MSKKRPIKLIVLGNPIPQPRARVSRFGAYYPAKYKRARIDYARQITSQLQRNLRPVYTGAVSLSVVFVHQRPKSFKKSMVERTPKTTRPDLDNLIKTVKDSLTASKYWKDDSQVVSLHAFDYYAAIDEDPHTMIEILEID